MGWNSNRVLLFQTRIGDKLRKQKQLNTVVAVQGRNGSPDNKPLSSESNLLPGKKDRVISKLLSKQFGNEKSKLNKDSEKKT